MVKHNYEIESYVWRESLYALSRMYSSMGTLRKLDKDQFSRITAYCSFKKFKPGQVIDFNNGGVFLKGLAK